MTAIPARRLQTAKNTLAAGQRYWGIGHNRIVNRCFSLNQQVIINPTILCKIIAKLLDFWIDMLYLSMAKLLQKSEMRKDIVIELSYKGFG